MSDCKPDSNGWMPIKTFPYQPFYKHGDIDECLLYVHDSVQIGSFYEGCWIDNNNVAFSPQPTYWQLLPNVPDDAP